MKARDIFGLIDAVNLKLTSSNAKPLLAVFQTGCRIYRRWEDLLSPEPYFNIWSWRKTRMTEKTAVVNLRPLILLRLFGSS